MSVKAKKLKSGSYRCQVYDYTDLTGKKHYKSFTSKDKKEAERQANEFISKKENHYMNPINTDLASITVIQAVKDYIDIKEAVLSPYTLRSYNSMIPHYEMIKKYTLYNLNTVIVQRWITKLARQLNPKTIRNIYSLFLSAVKIYDKSITFDVTLPQKIKPDLYTPNNDDVKKLLAGCKGTDLEKAILLAAFGPMRRGEICALTYKDIVGNSVIVNKAYAMSHKCGRYILKSPKTFSSTRTIEFPPKVIKTIKTGMKNIDSEVFKGTPNTLTKQFIRLREELKLNNIRFHDLRHYSASILHAIGVPDKYIMERGGWSSDYTMKRVYQDTIDAESIKITNKINTYFENL